MLLSGMYNFGDISDSWGISMFTVNEIAHRHGLVGSGRSRAVREIKKGGSFALDSEMKEKPLPELLLDKCLSEFSDMLGKKIK